MGGNALKNTYTRRYQKNEYLTVKCEIIEQLIQKTNRLVRIDDIESFRDKQSFGDLDLLIEYRHGTHFPKIDYRLLVESFNPNEIVKNGNVYSFDFKELQVDLIVTDSKFYDFSLSYYSFNDLGNLIGRVAHKMGLTYGHKGLYYKHRDQFGNIQGMVELTVDPKEAIEFLGYDFKRLNSGFDSLEEIFEYVVSSQYFNETIYALENRNNTARTRDRKRPSYTAFLQYITEHTFSDQFNYDCVDCKFKFMDKIQTAFPDFDEELQEINKKQEEKEQNKRKFNGYLVNELTGLTGKELGNFMSEFIKTTDILNSTPEQIEIKIIQHLNNERQNKR